MNETIIKLILNNLPQGSGYNNQWNHEKTLKNGNMIFYTWYHDMDEHGYYDGYTHVKIYLKPDIETFRIVLSGKQKYTDSNAKDYHGDTIAWCLENVVSELEKIA